MLFVDASTISALPVAIIFKMNKQTNPILSNPSFNPSQPDPTRAADPIDLPPADEQVQCFKRFDDMSLSESVLRGVFGFGFEAPSLIQQKGIVPMSQGRDMIMQAQAGTGKTGAFTIGLLQRIDAAQPNCQALILSPTRELAQQTELVVAALGDYAGVRTHCAIGGTRVQQDLTGYHVVCGTPGRVTDLINRKVFDPRTISVVVLDEVDVMLSQGFKEQVRSIFLTLASNVQAVLVSATLSAEVMSVAKSFLRNPVNILLPVEEVPLSSIKQFYVDCERSECKTSVLCDLYETLSISKSIIFCNTRVSAERLTEDLTSEQFSVSLIHSDMSHQERCAKMKDFRNGNTRVLIATDLLARGIDVQQVSIVVNYDMPREHANYIHRVGRGGRLGRQAVAINLVAGPRDTSTLRDIEQYYSIVVPEMPADIRSLL